jgi:3-deoxy-D-arabino-heptulosonate 7-phosphate (DAHP) synthase class II
MSDPVVLTPDQQRLAAARARVAERLADLRQGLALAESVAAPGSTLAADIRRSIRELEPLARILGLE